MSAILLSALGGVLLGSVVTGITVSKINQSEVGVAEARAAGDRARAEEARADADAMRDAVQANADLVASLGAPSRIDSETRSYLAQMEGTSVAIRLAMESASPRSRLALAGFLGASAMAMGKSEGAAAFEVAERSEDLSEALRLESSCPEPQD